MLKTLPERIPDEVQTICIARLYGGSQGVVADRGCAFYRHRRERPGSFASACDCVHDKPVLLSSAEPSDGWACRVSTLSLDNATGSHCWRATGGIHRALWIGQDSRTRNPRGDRGDPAPWRSYRPIGRGFEASFGGDRDRLRRAVRRGGADYYDRRSVRLAGGAVASSDRCRTDYAAGRRRGGGHVGDICGTDGCNSSGRRAAALRVATALADSGGGGQHHGRRVAHRLAWCGAALPGGDAHGDSLVADDAGRRPVGDTGRLCSGWTEPHDVWLRGRIRASLRSVASALDVVACDRWDRDRGGGILLSARTRRWVRQYRGATARKCAIGSTTRTVGSQVADVGLFAEFGDVGRRAGTVADDRRGHRRDPGEAGAHAGRCAGSVGVDGDGGDALRLAGRAADGNSFLAGVDPCLASPTAAGGGVYCVLSCDVADYATVDPDGEAQPSWLSPVARVWC